jgi:hypothetical protein
MRQQRLNLRGEGQVAVLQRVVQRADADAVAGDEERAPLLIPDGEDKLPVEQVEAGRPHLLVEVDDDLGVGLGCQLVPLLQQLLAQLDVVEDLAVEDNPQALILVAHRLLPAAEVDNAQPGAAQPNLAGRVVEV